MYSFRCFLKRGTTFRYVSAVLLLGSACAAQPAFEVASVKALPAGDRVSQSITTSPRRVWMQAVPLSECILWAYGLGDYQLDLSIPSPSERYEIIGQASADASEQELKGMMKRLLADRFQLKSHVENRTVLARVLIQGSRKPKMETAAEGGGSIRPQGTAIVAEAVSMPQLARFLSRPPRFNIVDQTGLEGRFNFRFDLRPYMGTEAGSSSDMPREMSVMIAAMEDQVGLKVASRKIEVTMLVVDHVASPSDN